MSTLEYPSPSTLFFDNVDELPVKGDGGSGPGFDESRQQMDTGIAEVWNTVIPSYLFSKVEKTETDEGMLYEFVIPKKFIKVNHIIDVQKNACLF